MHILQGSWLYAQVDHTGAKPTYKYQIAEISIASDKYPALVASSLQHEFIGSA